MRRFEVGIVGLGGGGGDGGGFCWARQGHRVRVFEQTPEPGAVGAGVLLQPSGQMVLERLGLLERVAAGAERIERLTAGTHRGKMLIDLPYDGLGAGVCAYGVHRGDLFMALYGEMVAAGVEVCAGSRVVGCEDRGGKKMVLDEGGRVRGEVDFVLGCDGARSGFRGGLGVRASVFEEYPHGAALGDWAERTGARAVVAGDAWDEADVRIAADGGWAVFTVLVAAETGAGGVLRAGV